MTELALYDGARKQLAEAATIDEAKQIADKAEALRIYARQSKNLELEKMVAAIKLRAKRRIGELAQALEKNPGAGGHNRKALPNVGKSLKTQALAAANLSTSEANRCEQLLKLSVKELDAAIAESEKPVTIDQIIHKVKAKKAEDDRKKKLQTETVDIPSQLFVGDFMDYAEQIPDNSIELIFTDPPYDRESIPKFGELSEVAARVLRPGGSVLAYCGQIQLPEVLAQMSQHLRYWWVNACLHTDQKLLMQKYGIRNDWKPIVWFVKGTRGDVSAVIHDTVSGAREKSVHEWQQAQSEAEYYIAQLCSARGTVWDPFAGGGTTLAACEKLDRNWIACEIDELTARNVAQRLAA